MRVYIVTEGYQSTGYGHITRCLSVCQAFEEKNIFPQLIVNGDDEAKHFLEDSNHLILNWLDNPEQLYSMVDNSDIVIVDSYKAGENIYSELYGRTKLLAVIDDYVRLNYKAHVVVNGTIGSESFNYIKDDNVKYLLGAKYIPLRKEFRDVGNKEINAEVKNILITLGGQDIRNLTEPILDKLLKELPGVKYFVVAKKSFNINFDKYADNRNIGFIYDAGAAKMKELMLKCDLAVTAAGQTIYELACTGLPSIAVIVADNQVKNLHGWVENGFIPEVLYYDDKNLLNKISALAVKFRDKELRTRLSQKGRSTIDGRGGEILCEILINCIR